jgi:transposase
VADRAQALVAAATKWLPEPEPTSRLGIDETRFASVRWILDGITWKRSDPWLTSFVDCSADGLGSLLGLAPGRTGACVRDWLAEQTEQFRAAIELVVIDPSAPYASGAPPCRTR